MQPSLRFLLVPPALAAALCVWSPSASAQTPEQPAAEGDVARAEQFAAQAFEAYRKKDYAAAVALYRKAFDVVPGADMLYNIARIYDTGIRDRPLAITFYRRYIADPSAVPERIEKANRRIEELRAAEQAMLDTAVKEEPGAAPSPPSGSAPEPPPEAESSWSAARILGLSSGIAGAAALGVGAVYGFSAMSHADTAHAECDGNLCRSQRGVNAARAAADQATVATVALSTGAALLAAGATLWFWNPGSEPEAPERVAKLRWLPVASTSELGLALAGGW